MQELIIYKDKSKRTICLIEDYQLVEKYDEDNNIEERLEGNIYIGKVVDVLYGMQAAFIDIGHAKNGLLHFVDTLPKIDITKQEKIENEEKIIKEKLIKGKKILVQVKRDSNQIKGAKLTTHISLVGKYLILIPNTDMITISQKITDVNERERLKEVVNNLLSNNFGAIIRTSAESKKEEELKEDLNKLFNRWEKILNKCDEIKEEYPALIEENNNIIKKLILDVIERDTSKIYLNNKQDYEEIKRYVTQLNPTNKIEIELQEQQDLLDKYDIKKQIEKSNKRKIWLSCGGFITIDKTEALTAIDVNSGKYTGSKDLENTVFKVNKEATKEIAKQLRLRDISGIVVIDYIDMKKDEDKETIKSILEEEMKKDRTKTQVLEFTKLNLLELTRKHIFSSSENLNEKEE